MGRVKNAETNPYKTPVIENGDINIGSVRSNTHFRKDTYAIILSVLCSLVIGGVGSIIASSIAIPHGLYFVDAMSTIYWIHWGSKICGRLFGDVLCGVLLGRFLKCISPWHVVLGMSVYLFVIAACIITFGDMDAGQPLHAFGRVGVIIQLVVQCLVILGVISVGVVFGRYWKHRVTAISNDP